MKKVKVFKANQSHSNLESSINEFINQSNIEVLDIQFAYGYSDERSSYTAMVIYIDK